MSSSVTQRKERLMLPGAVGAIECLLEVPADFYGARVALICHPHPLYQGTMDNKVVHTLARAMQELGIATLRFNFRGVGKSAGEYAEGLGEIDDAVLLANWLQAQFPGAALCLAGFSFGGTVAAMTACRTNADNLVTVAPAVGMIAADVQPEPSARWLLIHGADDELVAVDVVKRWAEHLPRPPEFIVMLGATHFFHGQLVNLRRLVVEKLGSLESD